MRGKFSLEKKALATVIHVQVMSNMSQGVQKN